jgi:hypothetical protein
MSQPQPQPRGYSMQLAYRNMEPEAASIRRLKFFLAGARSDHLGSLVKSSQEATRRSGTLRHPLGNVATPVPWLPVRWSTKSGGRRNIKLILAPHSRAQRHREAVAGLDSRWAKEKVVGLRSRPGRGRADDELRLAATWGPGQGWVARICLMLKRLSNSTTSQLAQSSRLSDHLARARCPL